MKKDVIFRFAESKKKKTFLAMMSATIITITLNLKASALKEREYLVKRNRSNKSNAFHKQEHKNRS